MKKLSNQVKWLGVIISLFMIMSFISPMAPVQAGSPDLSIPNKPEKTARDLGPKPVEYAPGEVIVCLQDGVKASDAKAIIDEAGGKLINTINFPNGLTFYVLKANGSEKEAIQQLKG